MIVNNIKNRIQEKHDYYRQKAKEEMDASPHLITGLQVVYNAKRESFYACLEVIRQEERK